MLAGILSFYPSTLCKTLWLPPNHFTMKGGDCVKRIIVLTLLVMALFCPRADAVTFTFEDLTGRLNGKDLGEGFRLFSLTSLDVSSYNGNHVFSPRGGNDSFVALATQALDLFAMDIYTPVAKSLTVMVGLLDQYGNVIDTEVIKLTSKMASGLWHFSYNPDQDFYGFAFLDTDWCRNFKFDNLRFDGKDPAAPVPEPGTLLLMGTGLAGLLGFRSRRRKDAEAVTEI